MPVFGDRLRDIATLVPGLQEKGASAGLAVGIQRQFTVRVGPPLLVAGVTYRGTLFCCPCDGGHIKEIWGVSSVLMDGGTSTLALSNYDKSAAAGRLPLASATVDPITYFPALVPIQLPLSATKTTLYMDEGDVLYYVLACAAGMTTAGQGLSLTVVVQLPEVGPV
jgi:hypothetical protein